MKIIAIESIAFSGCFLRLDLVHGHNGDTSRNGFGQVNMKSSIGAWEKFKLHENSDGSCYLESNEFPDNYVRADPKGDDRNYDPNGFGKLNVQHKDHLSSWEKFLCAETSGIYTLKSVAHGVYVRMDGRLRHRDGHSGFHTVNLQGGQPGAWEKLKFHFL